MRSFRCAHPDEIHNFDSDESLISSWPSIRRRTADCKHRLIVRNQKFCTKKLPAVPIHWIRRWIVQWLRLACVLKLPVRPRRGRSTAAHLSEERCSFSLLNPPTSRNSFALWNQKSNLGLSTHCGRRAAFIAKLDWSAEFEWKCELLMISKCEEWSSFHWHLDEQPSDTLALAFDL